MKVFLSHSSKDEAFAQRLAHELKKRGNTVWTGSDIGPGESVTGAVTEAITRADVVIPLLSSESAKSPWVSSEISLALAEQLSGEHKLIIPVRSEPDAEVPFFLKDLKWIDLSSEDRFRENIEELANALAQGRRFRRSPAENIGERRELIAAGARLLDSEALQLALSRATALELLALNLSLVASLLGLLELLMTVFHFWKSDKIPPLATVTLLVGAGVGVLAGTWFGFRLYQRRSKLQIPKNSQVESKRG